MNHVQILKRSWNILWGYKALWVFGVILAFTAAEGANGSNVRTQGNISPDVQWRQITPQEIENLPESLRGAARDLNEAFSKPLPPETVNTIIGIAIAVVVLALLLAAAFIVARYVSQTALIRMVDRYESSGEKADWRAGFRLGWSRSAWRLFLIDLLIGVVFFLGIVTLMLIAAGPLLLSILSGGLAVIAGVVLTIGLVMLAVFTLIVAAAAAAMARQVFFRECVLRGRGVLDSIRSGITTLRANIKNVFLLWLLLLALQIGFAIAMIPVAFILIAVALLIGGGAGFGLYLALQGGSVLTAVIAAAVAFMVILMTVVGLPMLLLRGLRETYLSTAWTLGYREIPAPVSEGIPS